MVDFRYHLVSIVAVFLALGIGVLMGSAVLGENLVKSLRDDLSNIRATNEDLRSRTLELEDQIESDQDFAIDVQSRLIDGTLSDRRIVLVAFDGTDGDMVDTARGLIGAAGGEVVTTVTILNKAGLRDEPTADQMALILGSSSSSARELRGQLGEELGMLIGMAADQEKAPSDSGRVEDLLARLSDDGFVDVQSAQESEPIPNGAGVLFIAGSGDEPLFRINELIANMSAAAAEQGAPAVIAEPAGSLWSAVPIVRADDRARALVSSVDTADSVAGQIAMILTLEEVFEGLSGRHYGIGAGAEGTIPQSVPSG